MIVTFEETYLEELYTQGKANDKKHQFPAPYSRQIYQSYQFDETAGKCTWTYQIWIVYITKAAWRQEGYIFSQGKRSISNRVHIGNGGRQADCHSL